MDCIETGIVSAEVSFCDLKIDRQALYQLMGYGGRVPAKPFVDMIDTMIDELAGCCTPAYGYVVHPVKHIEETHLQIAETMLQTGKIITTSLKEAAYVALFVATIGNGFEQWRKKAKDDMVRAFFADSLGSVLAEATTVVMLARIEREMNEQGLFVSNSYSPGYCDWKLFEQQKLFSFFPAHFCGVTLTESCLMLPLKSVSGIIGIGKDVKKRLYACEVCKMTNCVKKMKLQ